MAYTHNFEVNVAGFVMVEGQISFNGGEVPRVHINTELDMKVVEYNQLGQFLQTVCDFHGNVGTINKIVIEKIP